MCGYNLVSALRSSFRCGPAGSHHWESDNTGSRLYPGLGGGVLRAVRTDSNGMGIGGLQYSALRNYSFLFKKTEATTSVLSHEQSYRKGTCHSRG